MTPIRIHPHDLGKLIAKLPTCDIVKVGEVDEEVFVKPKSYTVKNPIWRINGIEYRETATKPAAGRV